jgi:hypothetical protein
MGSNIHRRLIHIVLASLLGVFGPIVGTGPLHADVKIAEKSHGNIFIELYGTISQADADNLVRYADKLSYGAQPQIFLNSTGGDADAAMRIGRLIRGMDGATYAADRCYGSCALIFIAGVTRFNLGKIGLHRPYLTTLAQAGEPSLPSLLPKLEAYVHEMGIADDFYQEIVSTNPSSMKLYDRKDIEAMVPEKDPTYDELETSYEARGYGVDTAEMRRRQAKSDKCDSNILEELSTCAQALKWGLSERAYFKRRGKIAWCDLTEEEKNTLSLEKRKEQRDHPLYQKREACVRSVMLGPQ